MTVKEAQLEVRSVFRGGLVGQLVSGALWLLSTAISTWVSPARGIAVLCLGGFLIFPLTLLGLRMLGGPATLRADNPLSYLAMQIAFTVPLSLPLVGAATLHHLNWFYPACMIVVGAHYFPFVFLYGMWQFWILGGLMVAGGVMIGMYASTSFTLGAWVTAVLLMAFAFVGRSVAQREARSR